MFARSAPRLAGFLIPLVGVVVGHKATAAPTQVDCALPEWVDTMFCGGSIAIEPYLPPVLQGSVANNRGAFSARMLFSHGATAWDPATDLRCIDGTEPYYYVDAGESNDWLFSFRGGGSCHSAGEPGSPDVCTDRFGTERDEMSSHAALPGENPKTTDFGGILAPNPNNNLAFASFNRIRPHKCSFDRYLGRMTTPAPVTAVAINPPTVIQQGHLIVERMLADLADPAGLSYRDCSSANCVVDRLPTMCKAGIDQRFVFAGHSGGAHGLIHSIDNIVDQMKTFPGCDDPNDSYHLVLDAHFLPMLENECRYDSSCGVCPDNDIFCHGSNGANAVLEWDEEVFETGTGSPFVEGYEHIDAQLDDSCLATHSNTSPCNDRWHVLANHVATRFFTRESLQDDNPEHCAGGDHGVIWANGMGWNDGDWILAAVPTLLCGGPSSEQSTRIIDAATDLADDTRYARGCEGGVADSRVLFLPDCSNHEGAFTSAVYTTSVGTETHYDAIAAFMTTPGYSVATHGPSTCP